MLIVVTPADESAIICMHKQFLCVIVIGDTRVTQDIKQYIKHIVTQRQCYSKD